MKQYEPVRLKNVKKKKSFLHITKLFNS